jgi:DNA-directed RNA polymerase subunit RPC12/RpoP
MECQGREEEIYVCADCGEEIDPDELYEVGADKLCRSCVLDRFKIPA